MILKHCKTGGERQRYTVNKMKVEFMSMSSLFIYHCLTQARLTNVLLNKTDPNRNKPYRGVHNMTCPHFLSLESNSDDFTY